MGKFVIKKTNTGYNFSLFASNSVKIAVSSQVYTTKSACIKGINSVAVNSVKCVEEDRIEDTTLVVKKESKKCPKFEIYKDKADMFRFRLIATNGENIAMSEEGYKSKEGCKNGIESIATNAPGADIFEETV